MKNSAIENQMPIIYAAGRMEPGSRRRFGITDNSIPYADSYIKYPASAPITNHIYEGVGYKYSGPYTGSCDHRCSHVPASIWIPTDAKGSSSHAMGRSGCFEGASWTSDDVFARSLDGIAKADCVFAWIDDYLCFGTINEIGRAHALGKPVYLAYHPEVRPNGDLWFTFKSARVVQPFGSANQAYSYFIKEAFCLF